MKPQFQHEITTSFALWIDNYLLKKGEAFKNYETQLYYSADDRLTQGLNSFSSPFKQWVFDASIADAKIPNSVKVDGIDTARSTQTVLDFQNGRVISSEINPSSQVTAEYAVKDFNIYLTNETEENLIVESKFTFNSRFKQDELPIPPYSQVLPAVFVNISSNVNDPFSLGGEDQTMTDIRCVVMAENIFQLDGALSIFNDAARECITALPFESYPLTEYGDAPNYNYETVCQDRLDSNPAALHFIERVDVSKLSDRVSRKIDPNTFIGFVDFEIVTYRYPRI
jgi:hypothetical protein